MMLAQRLIAIADFALAGQKYQHVAFVRFAKNFIDRFNDCVFDRHRIFRIVEKMFGAITDFHRISATGDLDDRCIVEVC